jgi:hypothetical protein
MMLQDFTNIWCVDFEFMAAPGENPEPVCLVARELPSGRVIRQWRDEFGAAPPYPIDNKSLFVAYYAARSWAAIWLLAGQCRRESSICFASFETIPMEFPSKAVPV